jgi:hypothetical protein
LKQLNKIKEVKNMYNYVMLIGTVKEMKSVFDVNQSYEAITLDCRRPFKNMNGEYESDEIVARCYEYLGDIVHQNLKIGMKITVKGRLRQSNHKGLCWILADQVLFIGEGEMRAINSDGEEDC